MADQQAKVKAVADIVFLIDATGSMEPCIDAIKANIGYFMSMLTTPTANMASLLKHWRAKVVGYRDVLFDPKEGRPWFLDNPFVDTVPELEAQLAALKAEGGGDEPESLLDPLFKLANMGATAKGAPLSPAQWRYKSEANRVVVVFTDASYHPKMSLENSEGGQFIDVVHHIQGNKIILFGFIPRMPCYEPFSEINRAKFKTYEFDPKVRNDAQLKLQAISKDEETFQKVLEALVKTVSESIQAEPA
jgi:hypothetical protein